MRIGVLASTRGSDLGVISEAIENEDLRGIEIAIVISNRENSYALERAREHGIEAAFVDPSGKDRKHYDEEVAYILEEKRVELILLIGYMKLLGPSFVDRFRGRIMNIHPSLLPAFPGGMDLNVHKMVLDSGVKITGCTLHFVDEGADTGPIALQKAVEIYEDDTPERLKERVQRAEGEILLRGIELFRDGLLKIEGRKVKVLNR